MSVGVFSRRAALAALLASTGCAPGGLATGNSAVPSPQAFLDQLRPSGLGRNVEAVQLVTLAHSGQIVSIELRLSITADQFKLVAQDMLGQRLMTIDWTNNGVAFTRAPNLPPSVSPADLLTDLVAICWPEALVRQALEQTGNQLTVRGNQRTILSGGRETMVATRGWQDGAPWTGRLSYRNLRAGYIVDVQSVEQS